MSPTGEPPVPRSFALVLGVGALQGLALWWLAGSELDGTWPAVSGGWYCALLAVAVFVPPLVYVLGDWSGRCATWGAVGVAGALLAACGAYYGQRIALPGYPVPTVPAVPFELLLPLLVLECHALPFLQAFLARGRWRVPYPDYFFFAWRTALQLALAAAFTCVFWLLIMLWTELFSMIGIGFLRALLATDVRLPLMVCALAFASGFHLAGSTERLLAAVREYLLALLKWLAIVAVLILFLFTAALIVRSPALFASHRHVISARWLLWLAAVTIYLFNAAYQDGSLERPYPRAWAGLLRLATPFIVLISAMALYALQVRISAYGLTVARLWAVLVGLIALSYSCGYVWAAVRPGRWMGAMGTVNVLVALFLVAAVALLLTPLLSPYRLAAASIANHILAVPEKPDAQDYMALRFDTGRYGREELARLPTRAAASQAFLAGRVRAAQAIIEPWKRYEFVMSGREAPPEPLTLSPVPPAEAPDAALRAAITAAAGKHHASCPETKPCPVLFVDLDGDSVAEAVVIWDRRPLLFKRSGAGWAQVATMSVDDCRGCDLRRVAGDLKRGDYGVLSPRWKRLRVGSRTYTVVREESPAAASAE